MNSNPFKQLEAFGQSIWLDSIARSLIEKGTIKQLIIEDGLAGITSNPSIFEKAIGETQDYKQQIEKLTRENKTVNTIYETLSQRDIQDAADLFRDVYEKTEAKDGYVSLEVNPHLAHDTEGTIAEARRLWKALDRPNVLIKVPGTREGLPAITQLIKEGINVNVTLLFSVSRYQEVWEAYVNGLQARVVENKPLHRIASVASFFLSRIDTLIDPLLEKLIQEKDNKANLAKKLHGEVAIASAKIAYQWYKKQIQSDHFKQLMAKGAQVQRLLWASTSTKNPTYSPVKYVEALIGNDTVNTLAMETLEKYRQCGKPGLELEQEVDKAEQTLAELSTLNLSITQLTEQLENEGVNKFIQAFDTLQQALQKKTRGS